MGKIDKTDIHQLMIEKYNGHLVYRARQCRFVVDKGWNVSEEDGSKESREHCTHCQLLSLSLAAKDSSYSGESPDQLETNLDARRKRGRPKGGRKRIMDAEKEDDTTSTPKTKKRYWGSL